MITSATDEAKVRSIRGPAGRALAPAQPAVPLRRNLSSECSASSVRPGPCGG